MKKSYLFLTALACYTGGLFSQSYVVQAPLYDGSSTRISAPSAHNTQKFQRSVFLVTQAELGLMSLTDNTITAFGFDMRFGTSGAAALGNFTVYLENTADITYNKGLDFALATAGMQQCYAGPMTIPASTGGTTMGGPLTNAFTYTGGGIYVAYDWVAANPQDQVGAWTLANSSDLNPGGATCEGTALPAVTTMSNTNFRPVFRFTAGNIATNEVSVLRLDAQGIVSKLANNAQTITAQIRNLSAGTLNNIPVTLDITGSNPFSLTQTITALASGATETVSFPGYNPTVNGLSTFSVTVPSDENDLNNSYAWSQSVTCTDMANNPPVTANTFTQNSLGFNTGGSGIISSRYKAPATCSLNAIRLAVGNSTINISKQAYGVLLDASGSILATSNTVTIVGANLGAFLNFNFSPAVDLTAGNDYYMGIAIPAGPMFPIGTAVFDPYVNIGSYFVTGINGGTPNPTNRGFMGIQAVLGYSNTTITSAAASKTIVCKNDGPNTVTLTAVGGTSTFTWTPGNIQMNPAVVSPSITNPNGGNINYSVTGTDAASGCRSNVMVVTVSVSTCAGLASNSSNGYDVKVFPNPSVNGKSTISGLVGTNVISVFNTLGQVVYSDSVSDESTTIDLSTKPAGNYLVKITSSNGESRSVKIVNQN